MAPSSQAQPVKDDFDREARRLRGTFDNPKTAKLEGHIKIDSNWVIIRIFCFSKGQTDGKDWFAIDCSYDHITLLQDGTAHGDPH
jgi:hypothetical protein